MLSITPTNEVLAERIEMLRRDVSVMNKDISKNMGNVRTEFNQSLQQLREETKQDLKDMDKSLDEARESALLANKTLEFIGEAVLEVKGFFQKLNDKIDSQNEKIDTQNDKIDSQNKKIDDQTKKIDTVISGEAKTDSKRRFVVSVLQVIALFIGTVVTALASVAQGWIKIP